MIEGSVEEKVRPRYLKDWTTGRGSPPQGRTSDGAGVGGEKGVKRTQGQHTSRAEWYAQGAQVQHVPRPVPAGPLRGVRQQGNVISVEEQGDEEAP